MAGGLLSLKWNHHKSTFLHVLSNIRTKESYSDVTIACDGKFYPVHKLVLSTCSEYFEQMFDRTQCKHPVVVLKDVDSEDLEALLNYMYIGEVNVLQDKLSSLIKAAEGLRIKGLAVADEDPTIRDSGSHKRSSSHISPQSKRRKKDDHDSYRDEQQPRRRREESSERHNSSRLSSEDSSDNKDFVERSKPVHKSRLSDASPVTVPMSSPDGGAGSNASDDVNILPPGAENPPDPAQARDAVNEILLEEAGVKEEPPDEYTEPPHEEHDSKDFYLHENIEDYDNEPPDFSPDAGGGSSMSAPIQSPMQNPSTSGGGWDDCVSGPSQSENSSGGQWQWCTPRISKRGRGRWAHPSSGPDSDSYCGRLQCSICPYTCSVKRDMKIHLRTHTGEKPYQCPYCSYKCAVKENLTKHICRKHSEQKPFHCPHCSYRAALRENLKCHMATHDRPVKCNLCSFSANYDYQMEKHMVNCHQMQVYNQDNSQQQQLSNDQNLDFQHFDI